MERTRYHGNGYSNNGRVGINDDWFSLVWRQYWSSCRRARRCWNIDFTLIRWRSFNVAQISAYLVLDAGNAVNSTTCTISEESNCSLRDQKVKLIDGRIYRVSLTLSSNVLHTSILRKIFLSSPCSDGWVLMNVRYKLGVGWSVSAPMHQTGA